MRPRKLVLVTGTGTGVGKTWVGTEVLRRLRAGGYAVAGRKPAQSYAPETTDTDADRLAVATGESPQVVCPPHRWYPVAMAPPMAASVLERTPLSIAELATEVTGSWPNPPVDVGLVEGVGGIAAPLADDGDVTDLAAAIEPDIVVLVADPGLGTINAVRLSVSHLSGWPTLVLLNRYRKSDDLQRRNLSWLRDRDGLDVVSKIDILTKRLMP